MTSQNKNSNVAKERNLEDVMKDFENFLSRLIERSEENRKTFLTRLQANHYYTEQFQWYVADIARAEAVEKQCCQIREYVFNDKSEQKLHERLDNISTLIDTKRMQFRVNIERSTNAVGNEVANAALEAMHGFLFSPNKVSDSDVIQEFCREAVDSI